MLKTGVKVKILYISAYFSFYKIPSLVLVSLLLNHLSLGIGIILLWRNWNSKNLGNFVPSHPYSKWHIWDLYQFFSSFQPRAIYVYALQISAFIHSPIAEKTACRGAVPRRVEGIIQIVETGSSWNSTGVVSSSLDRTWVQGQVKGQNSGPLKRTESTSCTLLGLTFYAECLGIS